jgi:excisionase family DNA binding protein
VGTEEAEEVTYDQTPKAKLLLEREVAEIMRCSASTIKRLRLKGLLAYKPGRPVLISEDDVDAYIERTRVPAVVKPPAAEVKVESADANSGAMAEAIDRARTYWLERRLGRGPKPEPRGKRRARKKT